VYIRAGKLAPLKPVINEQVQVTYSTSELGMSIAFLLVCWDGDRCRARFVPRAVVRLAFVKDYRSLFAFDCEAYYSS